MSFLVLVLIFAGKRLLLALAHEVLGVVRAEYHVPGGGLKPGIPLRPLAANLSPLDPGGTGQACLLLPFGGLVVRVEQDETLVNHIQIARYALIVLVELLQNLLGFLLWKVDQETLGRLDIVGCDVNLLIV